MVRQILDTLTANAGTTNDIRAVCADNDMARDCIAAGVDCTDRNRIWLLAHRDRSMTDYTAWLIENPGDGPSYFRFTVSDDDWTRDHNAAVHFARKQDAEQVIRYYG